MTDPERNIEDLLSEHRVFRPPPAFVERALVSDPSVYERAAADPRGLLGGAGGPVSWSRRWDTVMEWTPPWVKWFAGGS